MLLFRLENPRMVPSSNLTPITTTMEPLTILMQSLSSTDFENEASRNTIENTKRNASRENDSFEFEVEEEAHWEILLGKILLTNSDLPRPLVKRRKA